MVQHHARLVRICWSPKLKVDTSDKQSWNSLSIQFLPHKRGVHWSEIKIGYRPRYWQNCWIGHRKIYQIQGPILEVGKNINQCIAICIAIYFFPIQHQFRKSSESIQASSGPWPPTVPRWTPFGPRLEQLEAPRPWPHSRVGGWCAAETPLELQRQVANVWCTALSETVNSQRNRLTLAAAPCARG